MSNTKRIFAKNLIMERADFCKIISQLRKESDCKMLDICATLGVMPTSIYRLERGSNNFNLDIAIKYLKTINHIILLQCKEHNKIVKLKTYNDLLNLI